MTDRSTIVSDVLAAVENSPMDDVQGATRHSTSNIEDARRKRQQARRVQILSLKLAGVSNARIGEQLGIKPDTVRHLIDRTLQTTVNRAAEEMRALENARLDRAQAAIWSNVLAGDYRAVMVFLQISQRRAKLNGLDSPSSAVISANVRMEMERALSELQEMVLAGEVEQAVDDR